MNSQILFQAIDLVPSHGYWVVFIAMLIEGPTVTTAAAFASALGFYNIYYIFIISILGDIVADIAYFFIGKWGRENIIEKYVKRFGFAKEKIIKIETLLRENLIATLSAIKLAPGLAIPGLIIAGASKVPFRKFIKICLLITIPRSLIFIILGYSAGQANAVVEKYLHHSQYAFILIVPAIILINWIYKKISRIISQKFETL